MMSPSFCAIILFVGLTSFTEGGLKFDCSQWKDTDHKLKCDTMTAPNDYTIVIEGFTYDGKGPATVFMVGNDDIVKNRTRGVKLPGTIIHDEKNSCSTPLKEYKGEKITLTLRKGLTMGITGQGNSNKWIAIYCRSAKRVFAYAYAEDDGSPDEPEPNTKGPTEDCPQDPPLPTTPAPPEATTAPADGNIQEVCWGLVGGLLIALMAQSIFLTHSSPTC